MVRENGARSDKIEDPVISLPCPRVILLCVVDDVIRAHCAHVFLLLRVVHPSDDRAPRLRHLNAKHALAPTSAIDQDLLSGLSFSPTQSLECDDSGLRHGRDFVKAHASRFLLQDLLPRACVFGEPSEGTHCVTIDFVSNLEPMDIPAYPLDAPRQI